MYCVLATFFLTQTSAPVPGFLRSPDVHATELLLPECNHDDDGDENGDGRTTATRVVYGRQLYADFWTVFQYGLFTRRMRNSLAGRHNLRRFVAFGGGESPD